MKKIMTRGIKNVLVLFALIFISNMLVSCSKNKLETKENSNDFDIKAANNIADTYMKYLMKDDLENSKKLYSEKLLKNAVGEENKNLKISGYNISEVNEIGKSGLFKIKVSRSDISSVFASLDEYSVEVSKENNDYKIKKTSNNTEKEVFLEGNQIKLKNKNNVNTYVVTDMDGLPTYVFIKDDKSNVNKVKVPKNKFGIVNFDYSGDNLAITSCDNDTFIGVIKIDETLAVQGEEEKQGGGQDKQNQQQSPSIKEKVIGKEIMPLDILKNSKVELINFSPNEKFIGIQYSNASLGKCIRIYKMEGGDIIPFKFEENYPMNKVNVVFSSYDQENLNFDVIPKVEGDKSASDVIGKWQLSMKNFKVKKI